MYPSLTFCLFSFRSECPSQQYVSLQCSRKKMLLLLNCGLCGVGVRGREVGPLCEGWLALGSTRKRDLASRPASGPGFLKGTGAV